MKVILTVVCVL